MVNKIPSFQSESSWAVCPTKVSFGPGSDLSFPAPPAACLDFAETSVPEGYSAYRQVAILGTWWSPPHPLVLQSKVNPFSAAYRASVRALPNLETDHVFRTLKCRFEASVARTRDHAGVTGESDESLRPKPRCPGLRSDEAAVTDAVVAEAGPHLAAGRITHRCTVSVVPTEQSWPGARLRIANFPYRQRRLLHPILLFGAEDGFDFLTKQICTKLTRSDCGAENDFLSRGEGRGRFRHFGRPRGLFPGDQS